MHMTTELVDVVSNAHQKLFIIDSWITVSRIFLPNGNEISRVLVVRTPEIHCVQSGN
jgi:hypothetical protein